MKPSKKDEQQLGLSSQTCLAKFSAFFIYSHGIIKERAFYFYRSRGEIVMLAIRVSNHGARLNTQHPKLSMLQLSGFSQMRLIPPPRAKMGKHNSQWFDRNQMLGGPRTLVFAKWNSLFAWGFGECYAGTFHITGTICSLVATRVHERLVKVNAACKLERICLTIYMSFWECSLSCCTRWHFPSLGWTWAL